MSVSSLLHKYDGSIDMFRQLFGGSFVSLAGEGPRRFWRWRGPTIYFTRQQGSGASLGVANFIFLLTGEGFFSSEGGFGIGKRVRVGSLPRCSTTMFWKEETSQ